MTKLAYKDTNSLITDGLGFYLLSGGGQKLELYDTNLAKFSEATMIEDVVIVVPPVDVPVEPTPTPVPMPVEPPTVPVEPPVLNPPALPVGMTVSSAAALTAALRATTGNAVIFIAPGNYGDFLFTGEVFETPVTIKSLNPANPASFRSLSFTRVENLTVEGVSVVFTPNATTSTIAAGLNLTSCKKVKIVDCNLKSGPMPTDGLLTGRGISVTTSENITLTGNDISQFRRGIMTGNVNGLVINYNWIHDNRTSLLSGGGIDNALIEFNHLERSNPNNFGGDGDHGDFIHYWTSSTQTKPSDNIVIRNNFIEQGGGTALLGIYIDNNTNPHGFTNVTVENNLLHNSNGQGIRLEDVVGGIVRNNSLLQTYGDFRKAPRIRVEDGCRNIKITNNIVSNTLAGAAVVNMATLNIVETGTVVIPLVQNQLGKFVGLPKENATLAELQPIPGAFPAGVGATLTPAMFER